MDLFLQEGKVMSIMHIIYKKSIISIFFLALSLATIGCAKDNSPKEEKLEGYVEKTMHGFTVKIPANAEKFQITQQALAKLDYDLEVLVPFFSAEQITVLRSRPIWMEMNTAPNGAAQYHPSKEWLIENKQNPDKAKCVEFTNMGNYITWTTLNHSTMLLHELSHLYHDQSLPQGYENPRVKQVYEQAKNSGKYNSVDYYTIEQTIRKEPAYAMNNQMEYFGQMTEAYFSICNYYPFTYNELKIFDLAAFALMEEIWGPRTIRYGVTTPSPLLGLKLDFFYRKYLDASGLPVLASHRVDDKALHIAQNIVAQMLANCPDVLAELKRLKIRIGVIGKVEQTCDLPEHRDLNTAFPGTDWNARTRGVGATVERPLTSCGEENLLKLFDDRYAGQNILVHEFAHTVHLGKRRIDANWDNSLKAAFEAARVAHLWENTYAGSNYEEYFACGVQAFYNVAAEASPANGIYNFVNTREELKDYDIRLYNLIAEILSEAELHLE